MRRSPNYESGGAAMDPARSAAMDRKLIWIEQRRFRGWACSECAWVFDPPEPTSKSFDEVMRNFMSQRDEEFAWHVCTDYDDAEVLARSRNLSKAPPTTGKSSELFGTPSPWRAPTSRSYEGVEP